MTTFLATVFLIICVLLIVVILLQKGRGVGLSGAFGGMGSSAFGTRTGDVFTWVTVILVAVFLLLAVVTTRWFTPAATPVPTPTFVPTSKSIDKTTRVTIQCGRKEAKIFYTLDGGEPTQESHRYDGTPVPVQPNTVLKAKGFLRGYLPSKIAKAEYPHTSRAKAQPAAATTKPAGIARPPARTPPAP